MEKVQQLKAAMAKTKYADIGKITFVGLKTKQVITSMLYILCDSTMVKCFFLSKNKNKEFL